MSDVFDEIRAICTPERLLNDPRATGEGISVCILDSGVEAELLTTRHRRPGKEIKPIVCAGFAPGLTEPTLSLGRPSSPHGTTVADIILTLAPCVQLYSADVFGPMGSCEVEIIISALRWAFDVWKCQIVNLSLGVSEQKLQSIPRRQQLLRALEDAYFKDVIVVAAAHNDHPLTRSYPALYAPPLLTVDKQLFTDPLRIVYALHEQIEFQAHGRGYLGPFSQEPATSWAAPHLTGVVAKLLSMYPDLKPFEVKTLLYWLGRVKK